MPLRDVAVALGIPHGTARSRLHYALATMRSGLSADAAAARSLPGGQPA
jgi:DNA-directed RNA polymerase specialized sigma24 family protein